MKLQIHHTKILTIISALCCVLAACSGDRKSPAVSFYYWRTVFELSDMERQTLQENEVSKIYIRYFDVDIDGQGRPRPESPINFRQRPEKLQVVPVVFIKNRVMLQSNLSIDSLSENIAGYIAQINRAADITDCDEIQIDCDWTLKSRDRFMQFVDTLKRRSGKKLSATIRLHQVKYYLTTQIPNVDKAVLMYYNMGKIAPDSLNSIYDRKIAERYIKTLKNYPMKLNIALPIYAWGVHISKNNVLKLVSKTDKTTFENDTNFTVSANSDIVTVKNSTIKQGAYYLRNDRIKIEQVSDKELRQMSSDIRRQLDYTPEEIIFFDLDEINIKRYKNETEYFKKMACRF